MARSATAAAVMQHGVQGCAVPGAAPCGAGGSFVQLGGQPCVMGGKAALCGGRRSAVQWRERLFPIFLKRIELQVLVICLCVK